MKNVNKILVASLMVASLTLMSLEMNNVYAEHGDLPTDNPFETGTHTICLDLTQMKYVTVNNSQNNELIIYNAASNAITMLDTLTVMDLTYYSSQTCDIDINLIGADWLRSDAYGVEKEYGLDADGNIVGDRYSKIHLNWYKSYDTTSTCGWFQDANPEYIYNHEMGHFAGLDHASWFEADNHTIMKPNCNSGYNSLSEDDIRQINEFYTVPDEVGDGNE